MKLIALILLVISLSPGCRREKAPRPPQAELQYHADQPEPQSEAAIEKAIREGANVNHRSGEGLPPWLAAAQGVDETRHYVGKARTLGELKLTDGSNNPAASGDALYQRSAIAVLKVLLRLGADKNIRDSDGENGLHKAVRQNREQVVDFLIAAGVGVDVQDSAGYTPLMRAMYHKNVHIVKALLTHGASIKPVSKFGQNAMGLAQETGSAELVALIEASQRRPPSP